MRNRVRAPTAALAIVAAVATASGGCTAREVSDLDGIRERGTLRIIAPRLAPRDRRLPRSGYPIDFGRELAEIFAREHGLEPEVVWVNSRNELIPALLRGRGDLIAASLTVTPDRQEQMAFSVPADVVREQIVTRIADTNLVAPADLNGRTLALRPSSSYWETAERLRRQHPGLEVQAVSERIDTEEILYRVASGRYDLTIADNNIVDQAMSYMRGLKTAFDVTGERQIAWGLRPDAVQLKAAVDSFLQVSSHRPVRHERATGDLAAIRERGVLRVITSNSAATYFIWRGELLGFEYELVRRLARELDVRLEVVVPPSRASLLTWLRQGYGDLVAAGLTPMQEREARGFRFSRPYDHVIETVVTRANDSTINEVSDLEGRTVAIRRTSSYWRTTQALLAAGLDFDVRVVNDIEETEEIIDGVATGRYDVTVADSHILEIELALRDDVRGVLTLGDSVPHSWAVRGEDGELLQAVNGFLDRTYRSEWYNYTYHRYFAHEDLIIERVTERSDVTGQISDYDSLFRSYAAERGFDWRLLAAQAYEESRFNPEAVSFAGALGLMQLMPATASAFGYDDPRDPVQAVEMGSLYLRRQFDLTEDAASDEDRLWFALASYNAGFGHVGDARRLATEQGRDPDVWFGEVESVMPLLARADYHTRTRYGYCRCREPVRYVRRIRERFLAYQQLVPVDEPVATGATAP